MNSLLLKTEAVHYQILAAELKEAYADVDDETLRDTLEGISDLPQLIQEVVRSSLEDDCLAKALKERIQEMQVRLDRFNLRVEKKRQLASWAMGSAGLERLQAEDFSVSLRSGLQRLEVTDEKEIPGEFFVPQPARLDRAALFSRIKQGTPIPGACLAYGEPHICVRVK